jgi:hypothetical protein
MVRRTMPNGRRDAGDRRAVSPPTPVVLAQHIVDVLPDDTLDAWRKVAPLVPASMYLAGGTGLAVHLHHRVSRDLDFMFDGDEDLAELEARLGSVGQFVMTRRDEGTLNGMLDTTKVQFLSANGQRQLAPTVDVAGIRVASVDDIAAMKLKVVLDRGELRDYFDLMVIDQRAVPIAEALGLFRARFGIGRDDQRIVMLVRALGYFGDVADDPALPLQRSTIESYWAARAAEVARHLSSH